MYPQRTLQELRVHPGKWLLGLIPIVILKLIESRLYSWANERLDRGAGPMVTWIRDTLQLALDHPWWTVFVMFATYAIVLIIIAHVSALVKIAHESHAYFGALTPTAQDPAIIKGPHEVDLEISNHPDKKGLVVVVHNRRDDVVKSRVSVRDVRSFNASRASHRVNSGFAAKSLLAENIGAGFRTIGKWLIRIVDDHLEVGDTTGHGVMDWPTGDKSPTEQWKIYVIVKADGLPDWTPEFGISWLRKSDTIRVIPADIRQPFGKFFSHLAWRSP